MNKEKRKLLKAENKFLKAKIKMLEAQLSLAEQTKVDPREDLLKMSPLDYFASRGLFNCSTAELAVPDMLNARDYCTLIWITHLGETLENFLSIRTSKHIRGFKGVGITKVYQAHQILQKDGLSFDNPERIEYLANK